jgi:hypothetical protein
VAGHGTGTKEQLGRTRRETGLGDELEQLMASAVPLGRPEEATISRASPRQLPRRHEQRVVPG